MTYGPMATLVTAIFDIAGTDFVLWGYPNMLLPTMPPLFFVDLCVLPIIYMLAYQYFNGWKSFIAAMTIIAAFTSFIGEPIAERLEIYELNNWKHIYTFPIYIAIAITLRWLCIKNMKKQSKSFQ